MTLRKTLCLLTSSYTLGLGVLLLRFHDSSLLRIHRYDATARSSCVPSPCSGTSHRFNGTSSDVNVSVVPLIGLHARFTRTCPLPGTGTPLLPASEAPFSS